jgi:hypothetical protein
MKRTILFAALALLGLASPAAAQVTISNLPAASSLLGAEKIAAAQGSGCASHTAPCTTVSVTPAQIATYVAASGPITTAFQPLDADLTALAGVTSAADRLPYFSSPSAISLAVLTTAGRALLDDADATAQRATLGLGTMATQSAASVTITGGAISGITDLALADGGTGSSTAAGARINLGVVIGTDVQAQNANLAAIASATTAANKLVYWTGSGTASTTDLSAFGRTLIDDADAATARATLGVSGPVDIQTFSASGTWTKPAGARLVRIIMFAGGSGGGGGGKAATSTIVSGGAGGGGGGSVDRTFDPALVGSSVAVTIGAGGAGGAGATVNGAGADGTAGGNTTFGTFATAYTGGRGGGGNIGVASGGGAGGSERAIGNNATGSTAGSAGTAQTGAAGSTSSTSIASGPTGGGGGAGGAVAGTVGNTGGASATAGGGGGSGGGLTAANAESAGGGAFGWRAASATNGTAGGGSAPAGPTPTDWSAGTGGGGGGSSEAGNGGTGGLGGRGAGGGGGGASHLGNGGAGGAGGDGYAVVITSF